jgi:hypothetical protein
MAFLFWEGGGLTGPITEVFIGGESLAPQAPQNR